MSDPDTAILEAMIADPLVASLVGKIGLDRAVAIGERAAILEIEGHLARPQAEALAVMQSLAPALAASDLIQGSRLESVAVVPRAGETTSLSIV
jgi:hypothetical protein